MKYRISNITRLGNYAQGRSHSQSPASSFSGFSVEFNVGFKSEGKRRIKERFLENLKREIVNFMGMGNNCSLQVVLLRSEMDLKSGEYEEIRAVDFVAEK